MTENLFTSSNNNHSLTLLYFKFKSFNLYYFVKGFQHWRNLELCSTKCRTLYSSHRESLSYIRNLAILSPQKQTIMLTQTLQRWKGNNKWQRFVIVDVLTTVQTRNLDSLYHISGSQISRFSSKLVEIFLAVLNFPDPELTKIKFQRIDRYIRITLSELVDQQFKIGNVLK